MNSFLMVWKKMQKVLIWIMIGACCIFLCLYLWKRNADKHIYEAPDYYKADLRELLSHKELSQEDYTFLFWQTGLPEKTLKKMIAEGKEEMIYRIQDRFFVKSVPVCAKNSVISWEEWNAEEEDKIIFADLEDGDILITPCSHTFGWRNGHAAIVVDAKEGETLESVVLGTKSSLQYLDKWEMYPCVMVFRLKGVSEEIRAQIAQSAKENLCGIDYGLEMGFLFPAYGTEMTAKTHCAHLVWYAYRSFGYDLDSDGGRIVTPKDISKSPFLELVQVVGADPEKLWK